MSKPICTNPRNRTFIKELQSCVTQFKTYLMAKAKLLFFLHSATLFIWCLPIKFLRWKLHKKESNWECWQRQISLLLCSLNLESISQANMSCMLLLLKLSILKFQKSYLVYQLFIFCLLYLMNIRVVTAFSWTSPLATYWPWGANILAFSLFTIRGKFFKKL